MKLLIHSIGPGRYSEIMAVMSAKFVGFNCLRYRRMPADSNWNTPVVSPCCRSLKVCPSSMGICSIFTSLPRVRLMISKLVWMTVRFMRPRKSIFRSPRDSKGFAEYCVMIVFSSFGAFWRAVYVVVAAGVMMTPQACTETWRAFPSNFNALSITLR